MSVRFYDEALYNKINNWVKDPNMRILKPNEVTRLFQITADQNNDKPLKLPLIALSRDTNLEILSTNKKPISFSGMKINSTEKSSQILNAIPIQVNYQIDIYTRYFDEGDEYVRNFVFNLVNHPQLHIEVPYNNLKYIHNSNIQLLSTIEDNSDIPQKLFSDQFTRWTIKLTIDDAYLFSSPILDNYEVELDKLEIQDRITKEITEENI